MNNKVYHILYISFFYPPFNAIGSHRAKRIVGGLRKKGFIVSVITTKRHFKNEISHDLKDTYFVNTLNVDRWLRSSWVKQSKYLSTIVRLLNRILFYKVGILPETGLIYWRYLATRKAYSVHKSRPIDIIYSSSSPVASAIVARNVYRKYRIPWIAEFRDLWSQNHYVDFKRFHKKYNVKKEKKILKNVSTLITVTSLLRDQLYDFHLKPAYTIYNSFNEFKPNVNKSTDYLSITYAGSIIPHKRDPSPLFEALCLLKKSNPGMYSNIRVNFYTNQRKLVGDLAKSFDVGDALNNSDLISYNEIQKVLSQSHVFVLLSYNNYIDRGNLTGKLFEYLSYKKPVLAIAYPGEIASILHNTDSGVVLNTAEEIKHFLERAVNIYKEDNSLGLSFNNNLQHYTTEFQISQLTSIINNCIDSG